MLVALGNEEYVTRGSSNSNSTSNSNSNCSNIKNDSISDDNDTASCCVVFFLAETLFGTCLAPQACSPKGCCKIVAQLQDETAPENEPFVDCYPV